MKTIIAPTDLSMVSHNACLYAAKLAADIKAQLVLLHVMELPLAVAEYPVGEDVFDEAGVEKELEAIKNRLYAETHNRVNIKIINVLGSAEYEIKELCDTAKPFAVVMATHSYGVLDRFFQGSTTVYSARHLHNPVIIVPPDAKYQTIRKIALASDLQDIYEIPTREIEMIVKLFNAKLEIFYAAKNQKDISRNSVASLILDNILLDLQPQFHFVENEDILEGVRAIAEKHDVDLLIVIPRKHGPFHKSQTKDFVFYSNIPVMAIHEDDLVHKL